MWLVILLLILVYLGMGAAFLKFLRWYLQDSEFIFNDLDSRVFKLVFYCLALLIWPSYLFDLGENLVDKTKSR